LGGSVVRCSARDGVEVTVVGFVLDLDLTADVALIGLLIAVSSRVLYLRNRASSGGKLAFFLVDMDLLAMLDLRTAGSVFLVDADLLLEPGVAAFGGDGCGEGFKMLFVTFPSDVRSLRRKLDFAFYLDFC
jgi:hypothetical protein